MNGIVECENGKYAVCAPVPVMYYDWDRLYNSLSNDGYKVYSMLEPEKPYWFVFFDTFLEAFEFKVTRVDN